ncbi:MAG: glutaredoxin family protein [Pseudomonadota bacterium]
MDSEAQGPGVNPVLTLYGHSYCHLCTDMIAALETKRDLGFELELVDIEGRPELEARFGELVPVLMMGEHKICHYFLDEDALHRALRDARGAL